MKIDSRDLLVFATRAQDELIRRRPRQPNSPPRPTRPELAALIGLDMRPGHYTKREDRVLSLVLDLLDAANNWPGVTGLLDDTDFDLPSATTARPLDAPRRKRTRLVTTRTGVTLP
jgi:hypothetical protein